MKNVAVVIGRFQVPTLTEGHRSLIDRATAENDTVVVLLGTSQAALSAHDPLTYEVREHMITDTYPNARVLELPDTPDNASWSRALPDLCQEARQQYRFRRSRGR